MEDKRILTIIIVVHNEKEQLKICIDTIRKNVLEDNLQIIVIDNASEDETEQWLREQDDIKYVIHKGKIKGYAQILNETVTTIAAKGEILLLRPNYELAPKCISRMRKQLQEDESVGAVGPVFNGCGYEVRYDGIDSYEQACRLEEGEDRKQGQKAIGIHADIVMIKCEAMQKVGNFDEEFVSHVRTIRDYLLRTLQKGFCLKYISNAAAYCRFPAQAMNGYEDKIISSDEESKMKEKWGMKYFNTMYNPHLLEMMTKGKDDCISVLEIGCDCGATLIEIKNRYPRAEVYGYEINPQAAKLASFVARVEVGNIEDKNFNYEKEKFDYIIFGDVLEHLREPGEALQYCRDYLKPDGCMIASIPNLMHVSVMRELLKGNFTYQDIGLMDKTHIHMFTYNEIVRMFTENGYEFEEINSGKMRLCDEEIRYIDSLLELNMGAERFMYETYQYILRARKV